MDSLLMNAKDVCATLGIGKSKLWEMVGDQVLTPVHIGRSTKFPRTAVENYVARLVAETSHDADQLEAK